MDPRTPKTAKDIVGSLIRVGDSVLYTNPYNQEQFVEPSPVKVIKMHRQGFDGTILTTDPAPNPDYPHHFSCRAKDVRKQ